jgi:hypothetical protein
MYSLKAWPSKAKQSLDHVDWTVVTGRENKRLSRSDACVAAA